MIRYADENGDVIAGVLAGVTNPESAAIVEYIGTDGLEEMHVFISLAWFDTGSWAWGHFISEWGTRGIFQARATHSLSTTAPQNNCASAHDRFTN